MAAPNTPLNPTRAAYTPAALDACMRVLGTLVASLGPLGSRLVVVGGLVPSLLLPAVPDHVLDDLTEDPHPGTNDVDVVVRFGLPDTDDREFYQGLEAVLKDHSFVRAPRGDGRGLSVWQWITSVDGVGVAVEFLAPIDGASPDGTVGIGRLATDEATRLGDAVGALRIAGAELAHLDAVERRLTIALLENGGTTEVRVKVANLLPFVALKGLALEGRKKDKDPFDVVWTLNHWEDGPAGAARAALLSSVAAHPHALQGLSFLRGAFATLDQHGCQRYARFHLGKAANAGGDEWVRLTRDAHGTLSEFFRVWDAVGDREN